MDDLRTLFAGAIQAVWENQWIHGRLGMLSADGQSIKIQVPHRKNFVYVRMGANGDQGIAIARNVGVALRPNLAVRMRRENGVLVIRDEDQVLMENDPNAPPDESGVKLHYHRFIALQDAPSSYSGQASKLVAVNATEDALEFIDAPSPTITPPLYLEYDDINQGLEYGQLQLRGSTDPNQRLALGYDTDSNEGWIQAGQHLASHYPLVLQPLGGEARVNGPMNVRNTFKIQSSDGSADITILSNSNNVGTDPDILFTGNAVIAAESSLWINIDSTNTDLTRTLVFGKDAQTNAPTKLLTLHERGWMHLGSGSMNGWSTNHLAFQMGNNAGFLINETGNLLVMVENAYYDGTNYRLTSGNQASRVQMSGGQIIFQVSNNALPSSGDTIAWMEAMRMRTLDGFVGIRNTNPDEPLVIGVAGSAENARMKLISNGGRIARLRADDSGNFVHVGSGSNHNFTIVRNDTPVINVGSTFVEIEDGFNLGVGDSGVTHRLGAKAGNGTGHYNVGGILYTTSSRVTINLSGNFINLTIPANTLHANGQSLWFECSGHIVNGDALFTLTFDGASINNNANAGMIAPLSDFWMRGRVQRTSATAARMSFMLMTLTALGGSPLFFVDSLNGGSASHSSDQILRLAVVDQGGAANTFYMDTCVVGYDPAHS